MKPGDIVEVVRCDEEPELVGRAGVVVDFWKWNDSPFEVSLNPDCRVVHFSAKEIRVVCPA